jgi:hypothetical protein
MVLTTVATQLVETLDSSIAIDIGMELDLNFNTRLPYDFGVDLDLNILFERTYYLYKYKDTVPKANPRYPSFID